MRFLLKRIFEPTLDRTILGHAYTQAIPGSFGNLLRQFMIRGLTLRWPHKVGELERNDLQAVVLDLTGRTLAPAGMLIPIYLVLRSALERVSLQK
jgi:hypothetical protein